MFALEISFVLIFAVEKVQVFWMDIFTMSAYIVFQGKVFITQRTLISLVGHFPCTVFHQAVVSQKMFGDKFFITSVAAVLQFILRNIPVQSFEVFFVNLYVSFIIGVRL